jgi:hypothetical protein
MGLRASTRLLLQVNATRGNALRQRLNNVTYFTATVALKVRSLHSPGLSRIHLHDLWLHHASQWYLAHDKPCHGEARHALQWYQASSLPRYHASCQCGGHGKSIAVMPCKLQAATDAR